MIMPLALRRAARSLWRYPAITVLAVAALGLGIGLPTAMFSIVDAAILRGLPVANARRIMHLERRASGTSGEGIGAMPRDYINWQSQQHSFTTLGAFRTATVTLRVGNSVDRLQAAFVTPNAFTILDARATKGRVFNSAEGTSGAAPAIILSQRAWRERYGSDSTIVGRAIAADGVMRTVIGIMPDGFRFPTDEDAWLPLIMPSSAVQDDATPSFDVFGALRDGVSSEAARSEFAVIARRMAREFPATNRALDVTVKPFTERFVGEIATQQMFVVLAAVLLVLVVACANVANLLLVRAVHRAREVAITMALGASRKRIVMQLLVESLVLACVGSAVGIVVAKLGVVAMSRAFLSRLPYWVKPQLDARVLLFALVLTMVAAILAALVPALRTTAGDLSRTLRDDSRGATGASSSRLMQSLVVVELALSMGLLVNAGLLSLGATHAHNVDVGFQHAGLFTAQVSLPETFSRQQRLDYFKQIEQRLQQDPSVASAGLITALPGTHADWRRVMIDGVAYQNKQDIPSARYAVTSAAFFPALHIAAVRGRLFESHDDETSALVAVVNERFVKRFFLGTDPIGHRIRVGASDSLPWRTIVGVVPNLWMGAFDGSSDLNPAGIYVPLPQAVPTGVSIAAQVRRGAPLAATPAVRAVAYAVNPEIPVYAVHDMPQIVDDGTWFYGMVAGILAVCGASALLLATVGVYGVIAFSVGRRRREFGVRVALGADARSIVRLVLRQGAAQLAVGITVGTLLATFLGRAVGGLLFEVSPFNPVLFLGVAATLTSVALVAMLIPTIAASRVQPLEALRAE